MSKVTQTDTDVYDGKKTVLYDTHFLLDPAPNPCCSSLTFYALQVSLETPKLKGNLSL